MINSGNGFDGIGGTDYVMCNDVNAGLTVKEVEIVCYYDDNTFLDGSGRDAFNNIIQPVSSNAKGMLSGSVMLASNGEQIACGIHIYDSRGNVTEVNRKGLGNIMEQIVNTYTYTNKVASSRSIISRPGGSSVEYNIINSYNAGNDFLDAVTYQAKADSATAKEVRIAYSYDKLGRRISVDRPIGRSGANDIMITAKRHGDYIVKSHSLQPN